MLEKHNDMNVMNVEVGINVHQKASVVTRRNIFLCADCGGSRHIDHM